MKPDITISLTVDKENNIDISVKSRPTVFIGRYTKKLRGLPQRQDRCQHCEGKGCDLCDHSGLSGYESVEGIIANHLISKTKGETPKFSWMGSEDQNSLVLGSGRPFSIRVYNPKKRDLEKIKVRGNGITATLSGSEDIQEPHAHFIVKTKIHAKCENVITKEDLKKLNSLTGIEVKFENRSKMSTKKIYSAHARELGDSGSSSNNSHEFMLTIVADGGLTIKQFVGGEEYMKPNISELLNAKCECVTFDVLDVKLQ